MIDCWFWSVRGGECLTGELLDVNGNMAVVESGGRTREVEVGDVMPAAIDEWHEINGQFGVGA